MRTQDALESPGAGRGPAYRIHTRRMVLRCWNPADAPLLKAAIDASLDNLRPWMPWAQSEPQDVQAKIERLRRWRGEFDLGQNYFYGLFARDEEVVLGAAGLHLRAGPQAREIGYWVHAQHLNQGLATEAAGALTRVAFAIDGVLRVEIHCDPDNLRSSAVPRKLGYRHEATLRQRNHAPDGRLRDTMIWTMLADEYPRSPAAGIPVQALDVVGRALL